MPLDSPHSIDLCFMWSSSGALCNEGISRTQTSHYQKIQTKWRRLQSTLPFLQRIFSNPKTLGTEARGEEFRNPKGQRVGGRTCEESPGDGIHQKLNDVKWFSVFFRSIVFQQH